jgi:endonuclease/exonuclease/phosphatase (EEP) superfamily protein YafD
MNMPARRAIPCLRLVLLMPVVLALAACATVPDAERLLALRSDGGVAASSQPCGTSRQPLQAAARPDGGGLDPRQLRIASWNIHKGVDAGWEADLARYAAEHDVVLLQEAVLSAPMRGVLERAGHVWQMAGAFSFGGEERGVLVASRVAPVDGCTLREFEPIFRLPKSAMVVRFPIAGSSKTVAMSNLHGINFSMLLGSFTSQLEAVAAELARHDGPIVFAGDFNTWSEERSAVLNAVAARLGLTAVEINPDGRRRTFGLHLDHLFVRGFTVVNARAPEVKSSDHNPILVTLDGSR